MKSGHRKSSHILILFASQSLTMLDEQPEDEAATQTLHGHRLKSRLRTGLIVYNDRIE